MASQWMEVMLILRNHDVNANDLLTQRGRPCDRWLVQRIIGYVLL